MPLEANLDGSIRSWVFDAEVTDNFDEMLARSIPGYEEMREITTAIGKEFVIPGTDIVHLGSSRGQTLLPFVHEFGARNRYVGVEVSRPMRTAFRETFRGWPMPGIVRIVDTDLREDYPFVDASLTLAVLTLIFVPINYRQRIMRNIWERTRPGGANNAFVDPLLIKHYHALKSRNGYSVEEIENKAKALEDVQVPITRQWNEDVMRSAGFAHVEQIWQHYNFAAWVGVRE